MNKTNRPAGKKRWRWIQILGIFAFFFVAVLAFLIIGTTPKDKKITVSEEEEIAIMANLAARLMQSLQAENNQIVETCSLRLSRKEINTLLGVAIQHYNGNHEKWGWGIWENNFFSIGYSVPLGGGFAVNFSGDLQLDYQDQRIFCTIRSFHIGWLLVPQAVSQYFVDREIEKVNQSDFAAIVREFMVSFEPQSDGSIVVNFRPKKIGLLIAFLL